MRAAAAALKKLSKGSRQGSEYSNLPAAAAGSEGLFTASAGLLDAIGLLLRCESLCLVEGERERRSNLEARFGSGSVWSKRDRFVERRSSSAISRWVNWVGNLLERWLGVYGKRCRYPDTYSSQATLVVRRGNPSALECQARNGASEVWGRDGLGIQSLETTLPKHEHLHKDNTLLPGADSMATESKIDDIDSAPELSAPSDAPPNQVHDNPPCRNRT